MSELKLESVDELRDENTLLRARVAMLRAALERVEDGACGGHYANCDVACKWIASGALREDDETAVQERK